MSVENKYGIATANVLDRATLGAALTWGIKDHIRVSKAAGLDGVEVWPQGIRPKHEIESGLPGVDEVPYILSAHQSPREKIDSLKELQIAFFLPERESSFDYLEQLHSKTDGIPVVLYWNMPKDKLDASNLKIKQIQTDPRACSEWGADSAPRFLEEAQRNGFIDDHGNPSIVIDTHHIRHANDINFPEKENPLHDWEKTIPDLLPFTREIHLGVGRSDFGSVDKNKLREELIDLLNGGKNNTEVVRMLRFIAEKGWKGMVIIEMRPSMVKEYLGSMSEKDLISVYGRIRETLFEIFERS